MTDEKKGTGFWIVVVLFGILAVPIAYLVLLGPFVYFCCSYGSLDEGSAWDYATMPLQAWVYHFETLPEFYRTYLTWWGRLAGLPA